MLSEKEIDYLKNEFPNIRDFWLEKVSRTFTLSIRILPPDLKEFIGHAYLICRFLDSLEDAENICIKKKHEALQKAIKILDEKRITEDEKKYFCDFAKLQKFPEYEHKLLCNFDILIKGLLIFPEEVVKSITVWAIEMAEGMIKYSFGKDENPFPHFNRSELEEYTYYVAGTVGLMLSEIFGNSCNISDVKRKIMNKHAVAFGKALQYVNIIKDSRSDYQEGRCFIPDDILKENGLSKEDFFKKEMKVEINFVYLSLFKKAWEYLNNALMYIEALPVRFWRVRLFCIWPVVLAAKTLVAISDNLENFIEDSAKFKITRAEVKKSIFFSYPAGVSNIYFKIFLKKNKWKFYD